jgi:hypothetical protein
VIANPQTVNPHPGRGDHPAEGDLARPGQHQPGHDQHDHDRKGSAVNHTPTTTAATRAATPANTATGALTARSFAAISYIHTSGGTAAWHHCANAPAAGQITTSRLWSVHPGVVSSRPCHDVGGPCGSSLVPRNLAPRDLTAASATPVATGRPRRRSGASS